MKLLVIRAHPRTSEHSTSMRMADAFAEGFIEGHPDARVSDVRLYEKAVPEIDLDLLNAWDEMRRGEHFSHLHPTAQAKVTLYDNYTQQFLSADVVAIANPLWNLSIPTRLKAWIDTICRSGVTFRYNEEGRAEGLAGGKRVFHLQSSGGNFGGKDPASEYVRTIMKFLGCDHETIVAEGMDHEPSRAEAILNDAYDRCREAGRGV